jgi:lipoprotein-anchoring transpeptidase ErfK/SrfK
MTAKAVACVVVSLLLGGCVQSTLEPASDANLKPRDRQLLASAPYQQANIPEPYRRHVVDYHRKESPGTIVVDSDARFLYYVLPNRRAIRYGVTVGEEALVWSGVAKVGSMAEWPNWTPTAEIKQRMGNIPNFVSGGPHNPLGARALYLFEGNKDTLYRIHGTNQPEFIGHAISSGCIRLTNEDIIDLYNRVKVGSPVVVIAPGQGGVPARPEQLNDRKQLQRRPKAPLSFGGLPANLDVHDLRRNSDPHGHLAGAEPARNDHVTTVFDNMSVGVTRSILRRNEMGPQKRHFDLAAVRVARERQRHSLRHLGENVRLMHQQDHRIVGIDTRKRAGQIVDSPEISRPEPVRKLIAEPRQPEFLAVGAEKPRLVLHDRNVDLGQRAADTPDVVPPVVVAEDRPHAKRRTQLCQFARPYIVRHTLGDEPVGRKIVAQQDNQVGLQEISDVDHLPDLANSHVRTAGMEIGNHCNGEAMSLRPARHYGTIARDDEAVGLDTGAVRRRGGGQDTRGTQAPEDEPAPRQPGMHRRGRPPAIVRTFHTLRPSASP